MIVLLLISANSQAYANSASIFLNGTQLSAANLSQVEIVNNKVMVPIRVVEELGYSVDWSKAEQTVTIQSKQKTITMTVNESSAQVDDRVVMLSSSLLLKGNTSFVPLRFMSEEFGLEVNWDNRIKTVYLTSNETADTQDSLEFLEEPKAEVGKSAGAGTAAGATTGSPRTGAGTAAGATTGSMSTGTTTGTGTTGSTRTDTTTGTGITGSMSTGTTTGTGTTGSMSTGTTTGTSTTGSISGTGANPATAASGADAASTLTNRRIEDIHFTDNRLTITMDQTVQPKVFAISQPDRIVLDLPGTALSDAFSVKNSAEAGVNQIEVEEEYSFASKVRYSLFDSKSSTIRIVLDLSAQADYRMSTGESIIVLELSEKTVAGAIHPDTDNARKIVVIDAGHGDQDNGTTGVSGRVEKDFNLTMALKVEELLKQEPMIDVVLTRYDDTYVTRPDRAKLANDLQADAFISIHANSVLNIPTASGTETYYYSDISKPLADMMHKHLIQATQLRDRKVKYNNYEVLRRSNMPAALLEVGFLSNAEEEALLFTEDFQDRVAQGIADAIKEYFGIV
ncbi:AMIN domain-containing protein [Paenibacillus lentus]|uniref:AMIN domain-containing protein n=2 Tax=Paenibacillus lentus TaxID=1338368 RepID=A0A3Q8SB61_9BACL|nr:AMIN domain-containing protein [Paenibacillus lentus]